GMIKSCRRYWNAEIAASIVQLKHIRFDNPMFSLETTFDREDFTRLLIDRFHVPAEKVQGFFDAARSLTFNDDPSVTTGQFFQRFFPGRPDVVRLLMEPITFANGSTLEDPALTYGIVFSNFMSKGVYTFQGGSDRLIRMMRHEMRKHGVHVCVGCNAKQIHVHKRRVEGVSVGSRLIKCQAVISNANLLGTIFYLVGQQHFDPDFVEQARAVRQNNSSTQVYIALKPGEIIDEAVCGDLLFSSTALEFRTDLLLSRNISSRSYSFYYPKTRPGTDRCYIVSSTNANYSDWSELPPQDYQAGKRKMIEITLDSLSKYIADLRSKVHHVEAATPCTFQRYTLHLSGASFGTKFEGLAVSQALPRQIQGLHHTGSVGIIMSGWLGAVNYGVIVANEVDGILADHSLQAATK
ncbi:MAG TPA: phytoene dehydrogenase, partial [Thermoguttaceae bacterium]